MVAAMATVSGPAASLAALTEVSEDVGGWLRGYDGYRGVFVFADQNENKSRVITLWETAEDERAARQARGAMRDQLMAVAGLEVVSFEVYDVPGAFEVPQAARARIRGGLGSLRAPGVARGPPLARPRLSEVLSRGGEPQNRRRILRSSGVSEIHSPTGEGCPARHVSMASCQARS